MNGEENDRLTLRIESARGVACSAIVLGGMLHCNERYSPGIPSGYHELTWGVILEFLGSEPLPLTWNEDPEIGDPFFLDNTDAWKFKTISSLELQDVSELSPWDAYVGSKLLNSKVLRYATNYTSDGKGTWRSMPWGVELNFESGPLLIGAMHHGDFMTYTVCADEIVLVWDTSLIEKVKESRLG